MNSVGKRTRNLNESHFMFESFFRAFPFACKSFWSEWKAWAVVFTPFLPSAKCCFCGFSTKRWRRRKNLISQLLSNPKSNHYGGDRRQKTSCKDFFFVIYSFYVCERVEAERALLAFHFSTLFNRQHYKLLPE